MLEAAHQTEHIAASLAVILADAVFDKGTYVSSIWVNRFHTLYATPYYGVAKGYGEFGVVFEKNSISLRGYDPQLGKYPDVVVTDGTTAVPKNDSVVCKFLRIGKGNMGEQTYPLYIPATAIRGLIFYDHIGPRHQRPESDFVVRPHDVIPSFLTISVEKGSNGTLPWERKLGSDCVDEVPPQIAVPSSEVVGVIFASGNDIETRRLCNRAVQVLEKSDARFSLASRFLDDVRCGASSVLSHYVRTTTLRRRNGDDMRPFLVTLFNVTDASWSCDSLISGGAAQVDHSIQAEHQRRDSPFVIAKFPVETALGTREATELVLPSFFRLHVSCCAVIPPNSTWRVDAEFHQLSRAEVCAAAMWTHLETLEPTSSNSCFGDKLGSECRVVDAANSRSCTLKCSYLGRFVSDECPYLVLSLIYAVKSFKGQKDLYYAFSDLEPERARLYSNRHALN